MNAYEETLNLNNGELDLSRQILREYGNMSSVTVLFVLERHMKDQRGSGVTGNGHLGLITALGPGFSSESVLVKL